MRKLHWMVIRLFPGPFLSALGLFIFLLLMQFLMRWLPDIVGKGLEFMVVAELIAYNLAYMFVLAVPMSVLIAILMVFGRLAETQAYAVVKSAGISFLQVFWPMAGVGLFITAGMWYFNNEVLPESNFRALSLWIDIQQKRPGFELEPGVFYNGLRGYSILAESIEDGDKLEQIRVYDYSQGQQNQTVISADRGELYADARRARLHLRLHNGEVHRYQQAPNERYERINFARYDTHFDLSDLNFERSDPSRNRRSDRTMPTSTMLKFVDSLQTDLDLRREGLREKLVALSNPVSASVEDTRPIIPGVTDATADTEPASSNWLALDSLSISDQRSISQIAVEQARSLLNQVDGDLNNFNWDRQRINRHWVEIHKKRSMALACFLFILIGAPIGLNIRRGGLGVIGVTAGSLFLFYWVTLVWGEKFADRDYITPWVGIWAADILTGILAIVLIAQLMIGPPSRNLLQHLVSAFQRLFNRFRKEAGVESELVP